MTSIECPNFSVFTRANTSLFEFNLVSTEERIIKAYQNFMNAQLKPLQKSKIEIFAKRVYDF